MSDGPASSIFGPVTRRGFLVVAGAGAALTAGSDDPGPLFGAYRNVDWGTPVAGADYVLEVIRPDDALALRFRFYGMSLVVPSRGEPYIGSITSGGRFMVVDFPIQAIGEETSQLTGDLSVETYNAPDKEDISGHRARAFTGGQPTRLAFSIPTAITEIRPSLQGGSGRIGLLDWDQLGNSFTDGIRPETYLEEGYDGPNGTQTSIGAPYGLALSPTALEGWNHSRMPVVHDGRTELWHTRMGRRAAPGQPILEFPEIVPKTNAVWATNFDREADPADLINDSLGVPLPLGIADRRDLVRLMSDHITPLSSGGNYQPRPADAKRLMLTSGGAFLDIHGTWTPPAEVLPDNPTAGGVNVGSWTHTMTLGRDQHAIVTYLGYLLPFGHPAVLVKETVRRFEAKPTGTPVANLRTRFYVVIRQPEKTYGAGGATLHMRENDARDLPFRRVRINTKTTPNLTFTERNGVSGRFRVAGNAGPQVSGAAFCIAQGTPFQFSVSAWDWENHKVDFTVPMAFVTMSAAFQSDPDGNAGTLPNDFAFGNEQGSMPVIIGGYNALPETDPRRTAQLHGQAVALAAIRKSGDTTLRFDTMSFGLVPPADGTQNVAFQPIDQPRGNPSMVAGTARIPAVQTVSPGAAARVHYDTRYVDLGFFDVSDAASVILQVDGQPLSFVAGSAELTAGSVAHHPGVVTPDMAVGGYSRNRGVVGGVTSSNGGTGGVDAFKQGNFDPAAYFNGAKLLGGLDLESLIAPTLPSGAPMLITTTTYPGGVASEPTVTTTLDWRPTLKDSAPSHPVFKVQRDSQQNVLSTMQLSASFVTPGDGTPPTSDVYGILRRFSLVMFGGTPFLTLDFNEFSFHSRNGGKPTVVADIAKATFGGPLAFINTIEELLSSDDSTPAMQVLPDRVIVSTEVALPSIAVGVFSLTNVAFSSAVDIPFGAEPARVRFALSRPDNPFLISVMIFSGGGSVELAIGSDGVENLLVNFDFGAHVGIDVGVASGSIEIMAGITIQTGEGEVAGGSQSSTLTGFVKAHGELRFGFVGVSLTFQMSLTHQSSDNSVIGQVLVRVEVSVFCFSGEVKFTARKKFAGGNDPAFKDMVSSSDFDQYAAAFA